MSEPPEDGAAVDPVAALLGESPHLSAEQAATASGLPLDQARRLWRLLGFPERGEEKAYTDADVEALAAIGSIVRDGEIDLDLVANLARGVGMTLSRLADWELGALVQGTTATAPESRDDHLLALVMRYQETYEGLLLYTWRRHLAAALVRQQSLTAIAEDRDGSTLTVGFADIVGFTALSNDLKRDRIGDLVEVFEERCSDVIALHQGRLVKSMGDAVLFVNEDPLRAFVTAEGIVNLIGRDRRLPDVRLGLATGRVVLRLGDVYGPPVNLAARLTQVARRNRIIADATTAALLPPEEVESRALTERPARGFGMVEPFAVRRVAS